MQAARSRHRKHLLASSDILLTDFDALRRPLLDGFAGQWRPRADITWVLEGQFGGALGEPLRLAALAPEPTATQKRPILKFGLRAEHAAGP